MKDTMKRIAYLDTLRSFLMLWIVGFWHLSNHSVFGNDWLCSKQVTNAVLIVFMILSGYLNSRKKPKNLSDVFFLIKKRFRFYPLFFISLTSFWVLHSIRRIDYLISFKQYILSLFGLSYIFLPAPSTLWFIVAAIPLYLITPFMLMKKWGGG